MIDGFNCGKGSIGLRDNCETSLIGSCFNWLTGSNNIKGLIGSMGLRVKLIKLVQGIIS